MNGQTVVRRMKHKSSDTDHMSSITSADIPAHMLLLPCRSAAEPRLNLPPLTPPLRASLRLPVCVCDEKGILFASPNTIISALSSDEPKNYACRVLNVRQRTHIYRSRASLFVLEGPTCTSFSSPLHVRRVAWVTQMGMLQHTVTSAVQTTVHTTNNISLFPIPGRLAARRSPICPPP